MKMYPKAQAEDFVTTSNTERSVSFPFSAEWENYSSDLLSPVLQTPLCPAWDGSTEKVPSGGPGCALFEGSMSEMLEFD